MISSILIKTKRKEGFTLIELLVVIAIIGTLSTIGFLALTSASDGADDAKRLAELQSIRSAATVELSKNRVYPIVGSGSNGDRCTTLNIANPNLADLKAQLTGFTLADYTYCSDEDGTEFLVATTLNGQLPAGNVSGAKGQAASATAGAGSTATVQVTCAASGAASGVYCIGNL